MGQCGCGEGVEDRAVLLPGGTVVAYGIYPGCEYCHDGIGVDLKFYDNFEHYERFAMSSEKQSITPDEYGGNEGIGACLSIFTVANLVEAASSLEADGIRVGEDDDCYESIADWMQDNGLQLLQDAIRRHIESQTK